MRFRALDWSFLGRNSHQMLEWFAAAAGGSATIVFRNNEYIWNLGDESGSIEGGVEACLSDAKQKAQAAHEAEFLRLMEAFLEQDTPQ